jgi:hypothetical protein
MDNKTHSESLDPKRTNKEIVDLYYDDKPYFRYLYKKTEKLILATYLVTNLFETEEPLRLELRKISGALLPGALSFNSHSIETKVAHNLIGKFMEFGSWLLIANRSLLLSDMNYELMRREIDGLLALLSELEIKQSPEKNTGLNEDFFKDNVSVTQESSPFIVDGLRRSNEHSRYKGHDYKGHGKVSLMSVTRKRSLSPGESSQSAPHENTNRRTLIVELLQKKTLISVKDVADVITDYSEKTLQRELLSMVKDGVLKKEGERRWSRYRIAKI